MVTMENYEEYLLLHADGELSEAEEKALAAFMTEHPELRREMELYMATKVLPDAGMVYEGKEQLLKKPARVIAFGQWRSVAAAASIAALAVLAIWKWQQPNTTNINIVQVNNINTTAPKDTFTGKLQVNDNKIADVSPEPKDVKKPAPSLQIEPKAPHYVPVKAPRKAAQEALASIEVMPVKQLPLMVVTATPKKVDAAIPVLSSQPLAETNESEGDNALLARLPIKQEGVTAIADAVNNKLEKVKNIKDNIKNTDLSVRLWNKELFVVRF